MVKKCYDAPFHFRSWKGYPIGLSDEYAVENCHFQVYWEPDCKGAYLANKAEGNGFPLCYAADFTPETTLDPKIILSVGEIGYKFACAKCA